VFVLAGRRQTTVAPAQAVEGAVLGSLSIYGYGENFVLRDLATNAPVPLEQARTVIASAITATMMAREHKAQMDMLSAYVRADRKFAMAVASDAKKMTLSFNGVRMPLSVESVMNGLVSRGHKIDVLFSPREERKMEERTRQEAERIMPKLRRGISDSTDALEAISAAGYIAGHVTLAFILQQPAGVEIISRQSTGRLNSLWRSFGLGFNDLRPYRWLVLAVADEGTTEFDIMRKALTYFTSIVGVDREMEEGGRGRAGFDVYLSKREEASDLATNLGIISDYAGMAEKAAYENVNVRRNGDVLIRDENVLMMPLAARKDEIFQTVIGNQDIIQPIVRDYGATREEAEQVAKDIFEEGFSGSPNIRPDLPVAPAP
jgi:hypothetical protein